jgi:hypothetical protein
MTEYFWSYVFLGCGMILGVGAIIIGLIKGFAEDRNSNAMSNKIND